MIKKWQNQSRLLKLPINCSSCQDHEVGHSGADPNVDQQVLTATTAGGHSIEQIGTDQASLLTTGSVRHNILMVITQTEHAITMAGVMEAQAGLAFHVADSDRCFAPDRFPAS